MTGTEQEHRARDAGDPAPRGRWAGCARARAGRDARARSGEALVRVHAAAITRDELGWPVERLPATPSYELSGRSPPSGPASTRSRSATPCSRSPTSIATAPRPTTWSSGSAPGAQAGDARPRGECGCADGRAQRLAGALRSRPVEEGQRVLIHGAAGGVGHLRPSSRAGAAPTSSAPRAVEAEWRAGSAPTRWWTRRTPVRGPLEPVDLVFDTVEATCWRARARSSGRAGGSCRSPRSRPTWAPTEDRTTYFVVEPNRDQLPELAGSRTPGARPAIDSVFPLAEARAAFDGAEHRGSMARSSCVCRRARVVRARRRGVPGAARRRAVRDPEPVGRGLGAGAGALGFHALATTSSGFAFTLGRPDGGVTLDEVSRTRGDRPGDRPSGLGRPRERLRAGPAARRAPSPGSRRPVPSAARSRTSTRRPPLRACARRRADAAAAEAARRSGSRSR